MRKKRLFLSGCINFALFFHSPLQIFLKSSLYGHDDGWVHLNIHVAIFVNLHIHIHKNYLAIVLQKFVSSHHSSSKKQHIYFK